MRELTKEERIMFTKFYIFNERLKEINYEHDKDKRKERFENLKKDYLEEYNKVYNNDQIEGRDIMLNAYKEILLSLGINDFEIESVKKM